jgi:hypothetical protein
MTATLPFHITKHFEVHMPSEELSSTTFTTRETSPSDPPSIHHILNLKALLLNLLTSFTHPPNPFTHANSTLRFQRSPPPSPTPPNSQPDHPSIPTSQPPTPSSTSPQWKIATAPPGVLHSVSSFQTKLPTPTKQPTSKQASKQKKEKQECLNTRNTIHSSKNVQCPRTRESKNAKNGKHQQSGYAAHPLSLPVSQSKHTFLSLGMYVCLPSILKIPHTHKKKTCTQKPRPPVRSQIQNFSQPPRNHRPEERKRIELERNTLPGLW